MKGRKSTLTLKQRSDISNSHYPSLSSEMDVISSFISSYNYSPLPGPNALRRQRFRIMADRYWMCQTNNRLDVGKFKINFYVTIFVKILQATSKKLI